MSFLNKHSANTIIVNIKQWTMDKSSEERTKIDKKICGKFVERFGNVKK